MCGAALAVDAASTSVRRHIVVLFSDVEGFTSMSEELDPEVLRTIMDRYFRTTADVIWRYGGVTEKFIGDAVMAVFGMPVVREDDALRAVYAASDIVAELDGLNRELEAEYGVELVVRTAVHAGPVSASYDASGDFRVVGDTVNTASRLQSVAPPREVLVGEAVAQAVRNRVELAPMPPLSLKSKSEPVAAWRLVSSNAPPDVAHKAPLVGREAELSQLQHFYERTVRQGRGGLVVLLGAPGIGKSRLAAEFRESNGEDQVTVLSGHATPYGRGMMHMPIVALLESAPRAWAAYRSQAMTDGTACRAMSCLSRLSRNTDDSRQHDEVEEVAWALREFLRGTARCGATLLIWEDLHWAEPALLDVIEYLAGELQDLPLMQLCVARTELLDSWQACPGGRIGVLSLELTSLSHEEALALANELGKHEEVAAQGGECGDVCALVASASEGNPLFVELMLDLGIAGPDDSMPHTIQTLFAARFDQLAADDRLVLEMASVAGRDFTVPELEHLLQVDGRADVDLTRSLEELRRSRLITGSRLSARQSFAQAFGRDAAYEMTAKRNRLRWHLSLADRLEGSAASRMQDDEHRPTHLLSHHLEAALKLTRQLHPNSSSLPELAARAARALAELAVWAMDREDLRAAASLFERAQCAQSPDHAGPELAIRLSDTWIGIGNRERALSALGGWTPEETAPVEVEIQRELIELRHGLRTPEQILAAEQRIEVRLDDDPRVWCRFLQLRAHRYLACEQLGAAESSFTAALAAARTTADSYQQRRITRAACQLTLWGPTPVRQGLQRCYELVEQFADSRSSLVTILGAIGGLLAFEGDFAKAREALTKAATYAADTRMRGADTTLAHLWGVTESLAGQPERAAGHFARGRSSLERTGNTKGAELLDAYAARELVSTGRRVPAPFAAMSVEEVERITDPRTGALTAVLCAYAAADADNLDRVVRLVERAETCADRTDDRFLQGSVNEDVASVLRVVGRMDKALTAARRARERYHAKGVRAAIIRADRLISQLAGRHDGGSGQ